VRAAVAAELTKLRTVRATAWTLLLAVVLSTGLAVLVSASFRAGFDQLTAERRERFDPLFATFYGLTMGVLPLVVFGVLAVGSEYRTGMIHASLAAVPGRGRFLAAKLAAVAAFALPASAVTVLVAFVAAQAALGPHRTSFGADGVAEAAVGAVLYLTLMCLFAAGLTMALRSPVVALAVLMPVLFLGSQGLGNIPGARVVLQYLPDQAAYVMLHLTMPGDPQFGRDYGAWTGMGILLLWTAAAVATGYVVLRRRDA